MKRFMVGITGASGSIYGVRLVEALAAALEHEVHLALSPAGVRVLADELDVKPQLAPFRAESFLQLTPEQARRVVLHPCGDIGAGPASGTFRTEATIIAPCSVKTVGALAAGLADNLITRAGDVALKEGRPLLLLVRETPFSAIHLENMLRLSQAGACIVPAAPAFYHKPQTIEDLVRFMVQKVFDRLGLEFPGSAVRWTEP
jgi:4-hydroxy-3-polyprenylbenzoate decarboxylase